jgi:hypothetical protein
MTSSLAELLRAGRCAEQLLLKDRIDWTMDDWRARKDFLDHAIAEETDRAELVRLQGRLLAVCEEGWRQFEGGAA